MTRHYHPRTRISRTPDPDSAKSAPSPQALPSVAPPSVDHSEQLGLPSASVRRALGNRALASQVRTGQPERQGKATRVPNASIQRKLTGSWDAIQGIGHVNLAPTIWQDILREVKAYEAREVELVMVETFMQANGGQAPPDFPQLKTDLMTHLQQIIQLVHAWLDKNSRYAEVVSHIGAKVSEDIKERMFEQGARDNARLRMQDGNPDAPVDETRLPAVRPEMNITIGTRKYGGDPIQQVMAQRMMALRLLLTRLHLEFNDLKTGRHAMTSSFTDQSATAMTNRQARGGLNALDSVTYGARGHHFFKEDVGVDPNAQLNPAMDQIGMPEVDPQFGARSVAFARLDDMINSVFSLIEGANTRGMVVDTQFATHVRGEREAPKLGIVMEDARGPNQTGREAQGLVDQQMRQHARVVNRNDPVLQRSLVRLQMLDAICGQIDRHMGNYYVHMDPAGNVTQVIGIDNDLSLGATHRDITKVRKQYYGLPPIIDRNYAQAILLLQPQMVQEALTGVLGEGELSALLTRIRLVQDHLRTMPQANMKQAGEYDAQTANALEGTDSYFRDFEKNIVRSRYIGAMVRVGIPEPVAIGAASKTILKYKELGLGEAEMSTDIAPIIRAYHRAQPIGNTSWFLNHAERTVLNDLPLLRHLQTLPGIGGANWIEDVLPMLSGANISYTQIQGVWASLVTEVQNAPPATADQLRQLILVSLTAQQFAGRDRRRQQAQQPQHNNAPGGRGRFVIGGNRNGT